MRIVSLLPSATEILALIGAKDMLVGRSHECDFPPEVLKLPTVTNSQLVFQSSAQVDEAVRESSKAGIDLYAVDADLLRALKPDLIITQSLCSVCSIDGSKVHQIVSRMEVRPKVLELSPNTLEDVLSNVEQVGEAVGLIDRAADVKLYLKKRIDMATRVAEEERKTRPQPVNVAFLEWLNPLYIGGHWTPQLIEMAGGEQKLHNTAKQKEFGFKSYAISQEQVTQSDPDAIIIAPCGLDLAATEAEIANLMHDSSSEWARWFCELRAVKGKRVALVDGSQMFNRPGPRLVDALEWLSYFLYPNTQQPNPIRGSRFPWKVLELTNLPKKVCMATSAGQKEQGYAHSDRYSSPVGGFGQDIEDCHRLAMEAGEDMYTDPRTGFMVFTEMAALKRGTCCGRGCRHCPYGHWNVQKFQDRKNVVRRPTLLPPVQAKMSGTVSKLDFIFWSGGKDSYMAYLTHSSSSSISLDRELILLTTFNSSTGIIPEQNLPIQKVMDQAKALGLKLLLVPLPENCDNNEYVAHIREAVNHVLDTFGISTSSRSQAVQFVFGDLHLEDIQRWRRENFEANEGIVCHFPLFHKDYKELMDLLWQKPVTVRISSVSSSHSSLKVGQTFDRSLAEQLQAEGEVDAFGEKGEFHTEVVL